MSSTIKVATLLAKKGHADLSLHLLEAFFGDRKDLAREDFVPSVIQSLSLNPYQKKHVIQAQKLFPFLDTIQPFISGRSKKTKRPWFYTDRFRNLEAALKKSPQWILYSKDQKSTVFSTKRSTSKGAVLAVRLGKRKMLVEVFLAHPQVLEAQRIFKDYNYFLDSKDLSSQPEAEAVFYWEWATEGYDPDMINKETGRYAGSLFLSFSRTTDYVDVDMAAEATVDRFIEQGYLQDVKVRTAESFWKEFLSIPTKVRTLEDAWKVIIAEHPIDVEDGIAPGVFSAVESDLGVTLPSDYKKCLSMHYSDYITYFGFLFPGTITAEVDLMQSLLDKGDFYDTKAKAVGPVKADWWNPKWIPFAGDGSGNFLCFDYDPAPGGKVGQVITFWHEATERSVIAPNFLSWFLREANKLRSDMGSGTSESAEEFVAKFDMRVYMHPNDVKQMNLLDFKQLTNAIKDAGMSYEVSTHHL